ncbi:MAG: 50S ribosomal protein L10 [Candidatus Roizmanbacteria bacterium]
MVSTQKKSQVEILSNILKDKSNFLLVKIDKTTHKNLESLRKELRKANSSFKVIKNSLFEKALNQVSDSRTLLKDLRKKFFPLRQPSALITLDENWDKGLKSFYEFIQKEKTLSFKLALLDNVLYNNEETEKIAKLPSKNDLVAKIIGSLKAPMNKFVYSLKYNTNKLVYILRSQLKEVKS